MNVNGVYGLVSSNLLNEVRVHNYLVSSLPPHRLVNLYTLNVVISSFLSPSDLIFRK